MQRAAPNVLPWKLTPTLFLTTFVSQAKSAKYLVSKRITRNLVIDECSPGSDRDWSTAGGEDCASSSIDC